jgi:hypothetical protein
MLIFFLFSEPSLPIPTTETGSSSPESWDRISQIFSQIFSYQIAVHKISLHDQSEASSLYGSV